ncbi:M24 family metallopeptidase, partial [Aeromonas dhakensis]|uniref:M24 family metallopeptidase n=1 Tax=Aeromonas dhakensis TaxID=196024 RepID=UPI0038B5B23E
LSSSRVIEGGDSVIGIALPSIQGYICEEERTFLVGDVDDKIEEGMEILVNIREEVIDRVKPSKDVGDLDQWAYEQI